MKVLYPEGGRICSAHGVRGMLKVQSWCDAPQILARQNRIFFSDGSGHYTEHKVCHASVAGEFVLMQLEGICDRDAAFALRGRVFYLSRADIPMQPGAYLLADLIGLPVVDEESGRVYGTVRAVDDAVRGKMFTVQTPRGDVLLPDVPAFVRRVDPQEGIFVHVIPGLFEEECN